MAEQVHIMHVENNSDNHFKVPQKQWKKWDATQRRVFNIVFSSMFHNQEFFKHPKQAPMTTEYWRTPCYNAAWTAADAVKQGEYHVN